MVSLEYPNANGNKKGAQKGKGKGGKGGKAVRKGVSDNLTVSNPSVQDPNRLTANTGEQLLSNMAQAQQQSQNQLQVNAVNLETSPGHRVSEKRYPQDPGFPKMPDNRTQAAAAIMSSGDEVGLGRGTSAPYNVQSVNDEYYYENVQLKQQLEDLQRQQATNQSLRLESHELSAEAAAIRAGNAGTAAQGGYYVNPVTAAVAAVTPGVRQTFLDEPVQQQQKQKAAVLVDSGVGSGNVADYAQRSFNKQTSGQITSGTPSITTGSQLNSGRASGIHRHLLQKAGTLTNINKAIEQQQGAAGAAPTIESMQLAIA